MDDSQFNRDVEHDIFALVGALVAEERALRDRAVGQGLREDEETRLGEIEVRLDQCWDLLRQRRARADYGGDPNDATMRPAYEVESYES